METWIEDYLRDKKGGKKDYQEDWQAHRWLVGEKMYAMYGGDKNGIKILTLKLKPENGELLREQYPEAIVPGYYMNKTHWNSFYLDKALPEDLLKKAIDESYELIFKGLTKKRQAEILEGEG